MDKIQILTEIAPLSEFLVEFKTWLKLKHSLELTGVLHDKGITMYPYLLEFLYDKYRIEVEFGVFDKPQVKIIGAYYSNYSVNGKLGSHITTRTQVEVTPDSDFWDVRFRAMMNILKIINKPF